MYLLRHPQSGQSLAARSREGVGRSQTRSRENDIGRIIKDNKKEPAKKQALNFLNLITFSEEKRLEQVLRFKNME